MPYINRQTVMTSYDYYVLAAAATGANINRADDSEELKNTLLFGGAIMGAPTAFKATKGLVWDMPQWAYNNYGHYGESIKGSWSNFTAKNQAARQRIANNNFWNTVRYNEQMAKVRSLNVPQHDAKTLSKLKKELKAKKAKLKVKNNDGILTKAQKKVKLKANQRAMTGVKNAQLEMKAYKEVNQLIKEAEGLTGKELAKKMKDIEQALVKAKVDINDLKGKNQIVSTTKVGKACSWVKTKTGLRRAQNALLKASVSENVAKRMLAKGVRGGGAMAVVSMALEAPEIVKTYKELGAGAGTKQLLKSGAVVAAETAGWVVGAKVGTLAGTKIGTAIGTAICPGLGTAIGAAVGAVVGFVGGLATSWLCGKGARALVGKSELEIHKEKQARLLALQAKKDQLTAIQLADKATENVKAGHIATEKDLLSLEKSYTKLTNKLQGELKAGKITLADLGIEEDKEEESEEYQEYSQQDAEYIDEGLLALNSLATGSSTNSGYNTLYPTNTFFKYSIAA